MPEAIWCLADLPELIRARVTIDPVSGCCRYLYGQPSNRYGYRQISWKGEDWWVHRLVFTMLVGPIPPKRELDHVRDWGCIWTDCCYPGHLEPVTHRENMLRGATNVAAINAAKTHCPQRHALVPGNLVLRRWRMGDRICLTCDHVQASARQKAARALLRPSRFRGVTPHTANRWRARIAGRSLGLFADEEDAARAYDEAALARWGESARLNLPRP